ncbi:unnamed protein product, partial [Didymodactylos carnosus]
QRSANTNNRNRGVITMIYDGPPEKTDSVEADVRNSVTSARVCIEQEFSLGVTVTVYKGFLRPGAKYQVGKSGQFSIYSINGSKPCFKCRTEQRKDASNSLIEWQDPFKEMKAELEVLKQQILLQNLEEEQFYVTLRKDSERLAGTKYRCKYSVCTLFGSSQGFLQYFYLYTAPIMVQKMRRKAECQFAREKEAEEENPIEFSLIWYGSNVNSTEENRQTQVQLQQTFNYLKVFEDGEKCNYIRPRRKEKMTLIVSDGLGQGLIPYVHHLNQIIAIYVYCPKKEEQKRSLSTYRKDAENGFTKLIEVCKQKYGVESVRENYVIELQRDYTAYTSLWWYTRDTFVYKYLNRALRHRDIDTLVLFAFLIRDMNKTLKEEKHFNEDIVHVYRGQRISVRELERLKKREKSSVAINTFLSTSCNRQLAAVIYAGVGHNTTTEVAVLLDIEASSKAKGAKPFADIRHMSALGQAEEEVLFTLHTVFRVDSVAWNEDEGLWIVKLVLNVEEQNLWFDIGAIKATAINLKRETSRISLGYIFLEMKKYDEAEKYFKKMLHSLPEGDPKIVECNIGLEKVACERANNSLETQSEIVKICL